MYDGADPPTPPPPPNPGATGRYVYLLSRLRGRQITMEEATELFSIQQAMIRSAQSSPPPPPPPSGGSPTGSVTSSIGVLGADADWLMFLGLGMGAGLAAAMVKRMGGELPKKAAPPPARST